MGERRLSEYPVPDYSLLYPQPVHKDAHMTRLHLHLLSDSTGETLENIAKAAIAQFDNVKTIRHFWPMVRSEVHLQRILDEIAQNPGLVLFTLANPPLRRKLENRRSEEQTSELQSLMRSSYAVFC